MYAIWLSSGKAYPEYIELLAQVTSMQTAPGLNGCYVTGQGLSQSPEQLMETILEGLGATKGLGGPLGPAYISLQEEVATVQIIDLLFITSCVS